MCKRRVKARERYQNLTLEERREIVARRDSMRVRAADRARYYRHWDKRREAQAEYREKNPGVTSRGVAEWRERNPEKYRAHIALNNAVRDGKIVRGVCEECGDPKAEGHHEDYSRPLEVRWLCHLCHMKQHRMAA